MKRARTMLLGLALVAAVLTTSFAKVWAGQPKAEKDIVIGIAVAAYSDKFHLFVLDAVREECQKRGVTLIETDCKNDTNIQIENVESLISQGCDAIIMSIIDTSTGRPFKRLTGAAGIPLIAANVPFDEADYVVTTDSHDAAVMQGEEVARVIGGKGNIGIITGLSGKNQTIIRTAAVKEVWAKYPGITVISEDDGKWDMAKGMEIMETWLQSGDKYDAVVANSDDMALGAIRALEGAGMMNKGIVISGFDGHPDAMQSVKDGKLTHTIFQSPQKQGAKSVEVAVEVILGKYDGPKYVNIPAELITKDNVDNYLGK